MGEAARVYINRATFFADSIQLFDAAPANDAAPPAAPIARECPQYKWIHCANEGLYKGHHQGEFDLTRAVFEAFVRNFHDDPRFRAGTLDLDGKTYTGGIAKVLQFDYEHASEMPPWEGNIPQSGAPAPGWVLDVAVRNRTDGTASLWVFGKLGDQIRGQITREEYDSVSMAFTLQGIHWKSGKDIGPCLTSVAFTNHPFMCDLEPLAAANRPTSVALGQSVKPTGELSVAPGTSSNPRAMGDQMSDQLRERICKMLSIRVLLDDAAVGDAVEEAVAQGGSLKSLLESLGVANPDDALKQIPELRSAREKLAGLLSELDALLQQDATADVGVAAADVGAAMKAQKFEGEGASKALGAYRTQCINDETSKLRAEADTKARAAGKTEAEPLKLSQIREARKLGRTRFLSEYGITNVEHADLATPLIATKGGNQLEPPVTRPLPISERGADETIDLRAFTGNATQRLIQHLKKTEVGFDKLPFPKQIERASEVKHSTPLTLQ